MAIFIEETRRSSYLFGSHNFHSKSYITLFFISGWCLHLKVWIVNGMFDLTYGLQLHVNKQPFVILSTQIIYWLEHSSTLSKESLVCVCIGWHLPNLIRYKRLMSLPHLTEMQYMVSWLHPLWAYFN